MTDSAKTPPPAGNHELRGHLHAIAGYAEVLRDGLAGEMTPRQRECAEAIIASVGQLAQLLGVTSPGLVLASPALASPSAAVSPAPAPQLPSAEAKAKAEAEAAAPAAGPWALVVEDDQRFADLLSSLLTTAGFSVRRAASAEKAWPLLAGPVPDLITLDVLLPGEGGLTFLAHLKADPRLAAVPVVVVSVIADDGRGMALGAADVLQKPVSRAALAEALGKLDLGADNGRRASVLVVDDDPAAVEILSTYLAHNGCRVLRAAGGAEAIATARAERPDAVILDLLMPEVSGFDVIVALRADIATAAIPILVVSAKTLTPAERKKLRRSVRGVIAKQSFDRDAFLAEVRAALGRSEP